MKKLLTSLGVLAVLLLGVGLVIRYGELLYGKAPTVLDPALPKETTAATYASYWDAMANLDLESAEALGQDKDHTSFVKAVRLALAGDFASSGEIFETLYRDSSESELRWRAAEGLGTLLLAQSRWDELAALLESDPAIVSETKLGEADQIVAGAFRTATPERYLFSSDTTRVPMSLGWFGLPSIPVEVNGCREQFLLDTGASLTVIASHVADRCNVHPIGTESGSGVTSTTRTIPFRPALVGELEIGGVSIQNHPAAILRNEDLSLGPIRVAGVVGWPVIANTRVELDYASGWATFSAPSAQADAGPRNMFWLGYPMVALRSADGITLYFGLDTGAQSTSLKPHILCKLGPENSPGQQDRLRNLDLIVDGHLLRFEKVGFTQGVHGAVLVRVDGKLGSNVARHGRMVLNFRNGRFALHLQD